MSLILRQQCQPVLNENYLGDYHVRINGNKYLSIVGPCGQPLFTISGIEFVRNQPSAKEIEFAVELLGDFCATHKNSIKQAISAKAVLFAAPEPDLPAGLNWNENSHTISFTVNNDIDMSYDVNSGQFSQRHYSSANTVVSLDDFKKVMSVSAQATYKKVWKEQKVYADIKAKYDAAISALQTCNI